MTYAGASYISFDPGTTTGVVQWNEKGEPLAFHHLSEEELDEFLDLVEAWPDRPRAIIYEEYRVYGALAAAHTGSKVHTIQVIGSIKRTARKLKCLIYEVRADVKKIAALWSGVSWDFKSKRHMPHWLAAYLVGYWQLHKNGVIRPRVLDDY